MTSTHSHSDIDAQLQEEYERQILTMLIGGENKEKKEHIYNHLCAEMFNKKAYRGIFKSIEMLHKENEEINIANVIEKSSKEDIKTLSIDLDKEYITNANCDFYLDKILRNYIYNLLKECDSFDGYEKIKKIKQKYSIEKDVVHISDSSDELVVEYYNKWGNTIKTYYPQLDDSLGNLFGGDLVILAGATGMGKTCFALNLIMNMAKRQHKVLIFSLEMRLNQLQNRIIASQTNIKSDKFRKFTMNNFEQKKYADYACGEEFKNLNIEVCCKYDINIEKIREIVLASDCDIVFIDYLGLIGSTITGNTYEKVSAISRELKLLANETDKPFIVLHQLSRIPAERKNKMPLLSDLRDSGKIEQDADAIIFVYREAYYNPNLDNHKIQIIVSKSRHTSGRKIIQMNYDPDLQLIEDKIGEYMQAQKQQELGL